MKTTYDTRTNSIIAALIKTLKPLGTLLRSIWSLFNAVIQTVFQVPSTILATLSNQLRQKADGIDGSMTHQSQVRQAKSQQRQAESSYSELIQSGSTVVDRVRTDRVRGALVVGFEVVSFFTTLRGLDQIFGALNPALPVILACIIQGAIIHLCTSMAFRQAGRRFLLVLFLMCSIFLSFFGVAEGQLPYRDYIAAQYNPYYEVAFGIVEHIRTDTQMYQNPDSLIENACIEISQALEQAEDQCGLDAQARLIEKIDEYSKQVITIPIQAPDRLVRQPDGSLTILAGGTSIQKVPDPDAVPLKTNAEDRLEILRQQYSRLEQIQEDFAGLGGADKIKAVFTAQLQNDSADDPEFLSMCISWNTLVQNVVDLSKELSISFACELNLATLLQGTRQASNTQSFKLPTMDNIVQQWRGDTHSGNQPVLDTDSALTQDDEAVLTQVVKSVSASAPSRLRDITTQEVEESYHHLSIILHSTGEEELVAKLDAAKNSFHVESPFAYDIASLAPNSSNFSSALFSLVIAILNDLAAFLVGVFMGIDKIRLDKTGAITPATLRRHMYSDLQSVLLPMAVAEAQASFAGQGVAPGPIELSRATSKILDSFLRLFTVCPQLADSSFCRYRWEPIPPDYGTLANYLASLGFLRSISEDDAAHMPAIPCAPNGEPSCLLLSTRAERWLVEIICGSSTMELRD